jgi:hypothetical protein
MYTSHLGIYPIQIDICISYRKQAVWCDISLSKCIGLIPNRLSLRLKGRLVNKILVCAGQKLKEKCVLFFAEKRSEKTADNVH